MTAIPGTPPLLGFLSFEDVLSPPSRLLSRRVAGMFFVPVPGRDPLLHLRLAGGVYC